MAKNIVTAIILLSIVFASVTGVVVFVTFIAALINGNWGAFVTAIIISIIAQIMLCITKQVARAMVAHKVI